MSESPIADSVTYLNYKLLIDGADVDDDVMVGEITVEKSVNKISNAHVLIFDGNPAMADFEISNDETFLPGAKIEIKAGYDTEFETVFKGVITKHELRFSNNRTYLALECRHDAISLTSGRKNNFYEKKKDSDIISSILSDNGLSGSVDDTSVTHDELVQYYASDWDFIMMRADVNGLVAFLTDEGVDFKKPDVSGTAVLTLTFGTDILDFNAEMNGINQLAKVKGYSWDMEKLEVTEADADDVADSGQGNVPSDDLNKVSGLKEYRLQSPAQVTKEMLTSWATARMQRSRLAKIKTRITFPGNPGVKPGDMVEIAGMGDRFNGNAFVSSVKHTIKKGLWKTEIKTGLDYSWFREEVLDVEASPASGLIPAAGGLHYGQVKKIDEDPEGATRVLVSLPLMENNDGIWARLCNMYATQDAGMFFMPEINDEVIVGFLNDDPDYPIILGSLYSKKNKPPYTPDEDNTTKAIVTKNQLILEFNDEDKVITITTPNGNTICLDDDSGSVTVEDENSNSAKFTSSGVTIESAKDLTLKATGDIKLDAGGNADIKAAMNVDISGLQISNDAQTKFSANGQAMAELKASGNLTIKGAIVMIN